MSKENDREECNCTWQAEFVAILPEIQQRLRRAFRHLDPASREESIAEGVVHCLLSFARLHEQARISKASASTLAWYAALAVKRGRPAGNRLNGKEPLSRYAQLGKGFQVEQLPSNWIDLFIEDKRASVPDQVAIKMDLRAWLATLSQRMRKIAQDLALGFSTSEVARKYGVSAGRISQLRRALENSWATFQQES
jgi:transposase-like protein